MNDDDEGNPGRAEPRPGAPGTAVGTFTVERVTIEQGKTFSRGAMGVLGDEMLAFVLGVCIERWAITGEPPTALRVNVRVEVEAS